jgi:hypothetical protein
VSSITIKFESSCFFGLFLKILRLFADWIIDTNTLSNLGYLNIELLYIFHSFLEFYKDSLILLLNRKKETSLNYTYFL